MEMYVAICNGFTLTKSTVWVECERLLCLCLWSIKLSNNIYSVIFIRSVIFIVLYSFVFLGIDIWLLYASITMDIFWYSELWFLTFCLVIYNYTGIPESDAWTGFRKKLMFTFYSIQYILFCYIIWNSNFITLNFSFPATKFPFIRSDIITRKSLYFHISDSHLF